RSRTPAHVHAVALEYDLGVDVADARPAFRILELAILHARRHTKLALRRLRERKVRKVALHSHLDLVRLSGDDGLGEPAAGLLALRMELHAPCALGRFEASRQARESGNVVARF